MTTLCSSSPVDDDRGDVGLFPLFFSFSSLELSLYGSHGLVVCVCVCVCVVMGLDRWIGVSWVCVCGFVC